LHMVWTPTSKKAVKRGKLMAEIEKDVVLTTKEATEYLKISRPTLLKYIHLGKINAVKVGNAWRLHKSELLRFLRVATEI